MHVQAYPASHNDPVWEHIFLSLDDAQVDEACQVWFEQWCNVKDLHTEEEKNYEECMPALHALSNRVAVDLDGFFNRLDDTQDPLRKEINYWRARPLFTATVTGIGWAGFAIRCATDPQGYAGYMQFIERHALYDSINDLATCPHAGAKLKEALNLFGAQLAYPWIGAACIRWAMFGKDTNKADLPIGMQWLKECYAKQQGKPQWTAQDVLATPVDFGENAQLIKMLLAAPLLWNHMFLQENTGEMETTTAQLWLHWAESVGYECTEARQFYIDGKYQALNNYVLQGDNTDLEMMKLTGVRPYLLQKARSHHNATQEKFELPEGVDAFSTGL